LDRFPRNQILLDARSAFKEKKLMVCFGGNGRSSGFSAMTRSTESRSIFVRNVADFVVKKRLSGVDINWEYPGYQFGSGYQNDEEVRADYLGLENLMKELRDVLGEEKALTLAYYPDGRQEQLLKNIAPSVDFMHRF
jgi:chitinase